MKRHIMLALGVFSLLFMATAAFAQDEKSLTIKGSDTMLPLASAWADAFMKAHPDVKVSVAGGGSGTGIAALINKTTDIATSSRDMNPAEKAEGIKNGENPTGTVVARDAITMIVNPKNPIKVLSADQIAKIYTGTFTSWADVGGPDKPITVFSRESTSGTYAFLQEHIMKKADYSPKCKNLASNPAIVEAVAGDRWGIGYVGLAFANANADKVKIVAVKKTDNSPAIKPNRENREKWHLRRGAPALPLYPRCSRRFGKRIH